MEESRKSHSSLRVLLVASPVADIGFGRALRVPNLGLSSIAAQLDRGVCDVRIADLVVAGRKPREFLRRTVESWRPDVVGFSAMSFQFAEALAEAELVKAVSPKSLVVMGGYHATTAADMILADDRAMASIDLVVRGEGERTFAALVAAQTKGDDWSGVPGISFRRDGSAVHTPEPGLVELSTLRLPDRDSRILTRGFHLFGYPADAVETSRGCTHDCDFCSISRMYGRSYRTYAIERVIADLHEIRRRGAKGVFVADDNITLNGERCKALCEDIRKAGLNRMQYFVQASVRGLHRTPGLVPAMRAAGVRSVFLGIENLSPENLAFYDKKLHGPPEVTDVVRELRRNRIVTIGGFIIGAPDDTEDSVRANYEYAKRLGLDVLLLMILTPYPGTRMREKLLADGLVTNPGDFTKYTCFTAAVRTKHLSAERLFRLREDLGYRYPLDSGSVWRLAPLVPLGFAIRTAASELLRDPGEILGYLRGRSSA